jgi:alpha-L-fucosidase
MAKGIETMKRLLITVGLFAAYAALADVAVAQSSTAATAKTLSPHDADMAWQKASAKFAPERYAILSRVASNMDNGPFRADWVSLQNYRSPAWYDDANSASSFTGACIRFRHLVANGIPD